MQAGSHYHQLRVSRRIGIGGVGAVISVHHPAFGHLRQQWKGGDKHDYSECKKYAMFHFCASYRKTST
jgi:hypothetical protein